jgi:hypothetical protein
MSKTLIVMVGSFTICLLPMIVLNFIEVQNSERLDPFTNFEKLDLEFFNRMNTLSILASMFLIANSSMNAVIYSLMSWRFRMEAEEFFHRKILRKKNFKVKNFKEDSHYFIIKEQAETFIWWVNYDINCCCRSKQFFFCALTK